jgi:hypothetical protein
MAGQVQHLEQPVAGIDRVAFAQKLSKRRW